MNKELHRHDISDSAWEKIKRTPLEKRVLVKETLRIHGN